MTLFNSIIITVYCSILTVMSFYGAHRLYLLFLYYKLKHKKVLPDRLFQDLPVVTIQLPVFNEKYVVGRLIDRVCEFDYPKELLQIQVLDDSTDETLKISQMKVGEKRQQGFDIELVHRTDRSGYKAGALKNGLQSAKGEFVAIFDADFMPDPQFLNHVIHYFTDPMAGMVQTRWEHLNRNYSWLTKMQAMILDSHFMLEHNARWKSGRFFNFNGTAGIWRRSCIEDSGGWETDTLTEDLDLSYRAQMNGWKFVYLDDYASPAELPVEMNAFKTQQHRWSKGFTQSAIKLLPTVFKSRLPLRVKTEAFVQLTANILYPLMILFSLLVFPASVARMDSSLLHFMLFDLPVSIIGMGSAVAFFICGQMELAGNWVERVKCLPLTMAMMIGICFNNSKAVFEALIGMKSPFVRTPKYNIASDNMELSVQRYHVRKGFVLPCLELAMAAYFAIQILFCLYYRFNLISLPFLTLFLTGFLYVGLNSIIKPKAQKDSVENPLAEAAKAAAWSMDFETSGKANSER